MYKCFLKHYPPKKKVGTQSKVFLNKHEIKRGTLPSYEAKALATQVLEFIWVFL